jgi:hypothetical protein
MASTVKPYRQKLQPVDGGSIQFQQLLRGQHDVSGDGGGVMTAAAAMFQHHTDG